MTSKFVLALMACGFAAPALAADVAGEAPLHDWTGFYVGVHAGYGWASAAADDLSFADVDPEGGFGGVQAGYNHQFANNLVIGVEADVSFGDLNDDRTTVVDAGLGLLITTTSSIEVEALGSVRGRLGYAAGPLLPYLTGGLAWGRTSVDYFQDFFGGPFTTDLHQDKTHVGWTIGAGIEAAIGGSWTAKIEYAYADLGEETYDGVSVGIPFTAEVDLELHTVKAGINYRF